MNKRAELDAAIAWAYRPAAADLESLPIEGAERELLATIARMPRRDPREVGGRLPRLEPRRRRRLSPLPLRLAAAIALIAAAAALFALASRGGTDRPAPPADNALVRFAKRSPLVLLDAPGWRVVKAVSHPSHRGAMIYAYAGPHGRGSEPSRDRSWAVLRWRPGRLTARQIDRLAPLLESTSPLLAHHLLTIDFKGQPGKLVATAYWEDNGRVLAFRTQVPDLATLEARLAALRRVRPVAWLSALPSRQVVVSDNGWSPRPPAAERSK